VDWAAVWQELLKQSPGRLAAAAALALLSYGLYASFDLSRPPTEAPSHTG
jgi:uncharacterized membrane protein YbhN (UPF0104 family)